MDVHDFLPPAVERVLVALLVGLLIGLDRERAEVRKRRRSFAGVRTFPLIALVGAISVLLIDTTGPLLVIASFLAVAAVSLVYYRRTAGRAPGATTEIAAIATFLLGALAGAGQLLVAGGLGIGIAALLVAKPRLEGFSRALSEDEITAALELAVIAGIVLPLLPNEGLGPWDVWNPFSIWLVVVLVSAVSFAGFVAARTFGQTRGLAVAGVVGGLVSSTAATAAMATRSRESPQLAEPAAAAAILASVVMCPRVVAFAAAFGAGIVPRLAPVAAAMAIVGGLAALWIGRGSKPQRRRREADVSNPTNLLAALSFAAIYAVIRLTVKAAEVFYGSAGMYAAASLSAIVDVDSVVIALASAGPQSDGWKSAATAASIALIVNTLFKIGLALFLGGAGFRLRVALALALTASAGGATTAVVYLWL